MVKKLHLSNAFMTAGGGHEWLDHVSARSETAWMQKLQRDVPAYQAYIDNIRGTYQAFALKIEYMQADRQLGEESRESESRRLVRERDNRLAEIDSEVSAPSSQEVLARKRLLAAAADATEQLIKRQG